MSPGSTRLVISLLIAVLTSACDQGSGTSAQRRGGDEPTADAVGRLIQQVKDDLADDRLAEALALMDRLLAIRTRQPPARQVEIDRLDAMFAAERAAGRR